MAELRLEEAFCGLTRFAIRLLRLRQLSLLYVIIG